MSERIPWRNIALRVLFATSVATGGTIVAGKMSQGSDGIPTTIKSMLFSPNRYLYLFDPSRGIFVDVLKGDIPVWEHPALSPSGNELAFEKFGGKAIGAELWVTNLNSGDRWPITAELTHSSSNNPSWSPDGKQIAYSAVKDRGSKVDLHIVNKDGTNDRLLVTDASNPSWSPKGNLILYNTPGIGIQPRIMATNTEGDISDAGISGRLPVFTHDGGSFVFVGVPVASDLFITSLVNPKEFKNILSMPVGETIEVVKWQEGQIYFETLSLVQSTAVRKAYLVNHDGSNLKKIK